MKTKLIVAAMALLMMTSATYADTDADQDTTPVAKCEGLPPSVSIQVFSWKETTKVCQEMIQVLEGIRHKDITNFEKAVMVLHFSSPELTGAPSYGTDNMKILKELIEIIRLRGLYDKPDRWFDTNELIVKSWNGFSGAVSPHDVIDFLRSSGPVAKTLSDDGLVNMIILIKRQHQSGN